MKKETIRWAVKVAVIAVGGHFFVWVAILCGFLLDSLLGTEWLGGLGFIAAWAAFLGLAALISRVGLENRDDVKKMSFRQRLRTPLVHILPAVAILLAVNVLPDAMNDMAYAVSGRGESHKAKKYLEKADEIIDYQNGRSEFYNGKGLPFDRNTMFIDYDEMHLTLIHGHLVDSGLKGRGNASFRPLKEVDSNAYDGQDIMLECPLEAPGKRITFYMDEYPSWTKAIIVEMADGTLWEGQGGWLDADYYLAKAQNRVFENSEEVIELDFGTDIAEFPKYSRGINTNTIFIDYGDKDDYYDAGVTYFYMAEDKPRDEQPVYKLDWDVRSFKSAEVTDLEKLDVCAELRLEAPGKRLFIYIGSSDDSEDMVSRGLILATEDGRYFTARVSGDFFADHIFDPKEKPDSSELPWSK